MENLLYFLPPALFAGKCDSSSFSHRCHRDFRLYRVDISYTRGQQAGLIVGHSDMDLPEVSEDVATEAFIHHVLFQARLEYNGCIFESHRNK